MLFLNTLKFGPSMKPKKKILLSKYPKFLYTSWEMRQQYIKSSGTPWWHRVDDWQGILQLWNVNMCLIRCCHHHPQTWKQHMASLKFWVRKMSPKKTSGLLQRPLKATLLDHTVFVYIYSFTFKERSALCT